MLPYVFRRPLIGTVLAYIALLTALHLRGWEPSPGPRDPSRLAGGRSVELTGRLAREPEFGRGWVRFILQAERISADGGPARGVSGKVLVQARRPPPGAGWGDRVLVRGTLERFPSRTVPGTFDARTFWARRGIFSRLSARTQDPSGRTGRVLEKAPITSPRKWMGLLRRKCLGIYRRRLSSASAELVSGLVLGKKPVGFPEMDRDFRRSGTYHLLVASGSNVGFVIGLWTLAAGWVLGLPRHLVLAGAIPCAWLYAGMAGLDPPVTRAAVMFTFGLIAVLIEREDRLAQALALSAGLLLAWRPAALFEAGFQMSYAATLGILLGTPALDSLVRARRLWVRWGAAIFFTGFTAQLALSPILLHYFHRLSWIGLLANLVAAPWAGLCLFLGVLLAAADLSGAARAAAAAAWLTEKSAAGLWRAVGFFASVPGAEWTPVWSGRQTAALSVLVALTFAAWGAVRPPPEGEGAARGHRRLWGFVVFLWALGLPALHALRPKPATGRLSVAWLDAGAGDAQVVTDPAGRLTLVNAGGADFGTYRLVPFLRARAAAELRRVVLTRADPRHAAGLAAVLREFRAGEILCPESVWRRPEIAPLRALADEKKVPVRFLTAAGSWTENGAAWRVLAPEGFPPARAAPLALSVRFGARAALLANDLSLRAQAKALEDWPGPLSVLQAPGHGAVDADERFLAAGNPRWIVFAARNPPEGFRPPPSAERVFAAGRDGSVEWRTDGTSAECIFLAKPLEYPSYE